MKSIIIGKILIVVTIALMLNSFTYTGGDKSKIYMKAHVGKGSVMLRWAPADYDTWKKGNSYGYRIEKMLVSRNGKISSYHKGQIIQLATVKALKELDWEPLVRKDSVWAPVALQCLWGETFELTSSFKSNMMEAYNKIKENESRFGFALYSADRSLDVAAALGLFYEDKIRDRSEKYIYRVYLNSPAGEKSDTAYAVVHYDRLSEYIKPKKPLVNVMAKAILLNWEAQGRDYVGYYVERSYDGKAYSRIGNRLVVPVGEGGKLTGYFTDSISGSHTRYYYRIVGLSPFQVEGPASDTLLVRAYEEITPPSSVEAVGSKPGEVVVSWKYQDSRKMLSYFKVERSSKVDTGYRTVGDRIGANLRSWADRTPIPNGYYRVVAVSRQGAEGTSLSTYLPAVDSLPPSPPAGLVGRVDSMGIVTLQWRKNPEPDLLGYRVFRSNSRNGGYSQLTSKIDTACQLSDTLFLRTLTGSVFYKLAAVDKRYNASGFSEVLQLKRPDIVKPAPPILRKVTALEKGVLVEWEHSASTDVASYRIYKLGTDFPLSAIAQTSYVSSFIDTSTSKKGLYKYWLIAVDSSGNHSDSSNVVSVELNPVNDRRELQLKGRIDDNKGIVQVHLFWNVVGNSTFYLYKKKDSSFILFKTFKSSELEFREEFIQNKPMEYFIRTKDINGRDVVSKSIKLGML